MSVFGLAPGSVKPRNRSTRLAHFIEPRNPTRSQTLTPSPPSRPPVSTQDYFHYGLIPAIIVIGMTTTPRPSLSQLLTPV